MAELYFEKQADQLYSAFIASGDLCDFSEYQLAGDQWQLDAYFLKWKPWLEFLGVPSLYQLDRLSGRFSTIQSEIKTPQTSYNISPEIYFEWLSHSFEQESLLVGARYGSSVFMALDENKVYRVYKTEDGLIAKTIVRRPVQREDGLLLLTIDRGCAAGPTHIHRLSKLFNEMALRYL